MPEHFPDEILDVLPPYSGFVWVWRLEGKQVRQGMEVPAVGMSKNYSVLLDGVGPPRFTWVQNGKITGPMAHKPLLGASVFDARGCYLGQGGTTLQEPSPLGAAGSHASEGLVEAVLATQVKTPSKPEVRPVPKRAMLPHRFHLRSDFMLELSLPADLTHKEVARITRFLEALPFGSETEE